MIFNDCYLREKMGFLTVFIASMNILNNYDKNNRYSLDCVSSIPWRVRQ